MIRAELSRGRILVSTDAEGMKLAAALPGATRSASMYIGTWQMPPVLESIVALRNAHAKASAELIAFAKQLLSAHKYVDAQKNADVVTPLRDFPVKPGVKLYQHQIKMANIALALFGYTSDGISNAVNPGGAVAILADMGTGKTAATVTVSGQLYADKRIERVLIVAPSSVCAVWPGEYEHFAGFSFRIGMLLGDRAKRLAALKRLTARSSIRTEQPLQVAIINYESVRLLEPELKAYAPDLIIADESQRIKNHSAKQSKAMHRIGDIAKYKMILTGTPITQDTRDVWSQYRFLNADIFGSSYYAFMKHFANMGGYGQHQYLGPRNLEELTRKAHSIAYRVTKADCLDLPEKIFEDRPVALEPEARALYRQIQKESFALLEAGAEGERSEITAPIILTRLLRLQQLTGGFITDDDGKVRHVSTAKLDATEDIARSLCVDEGKKLVIFARFKPEIEALRERIDSVLHPSGLKQVSISGEVPLTKRGALVEQFQTDPDTRVMIGQVDACAEGITLHAASTTLYYSSSWNFAKYSQSQDRTHRIGQDKATLYIHLMVPGTIDTKIMSALKKKEDLARSVVDNWRSLFAADDGGDDS